MEGSMPAQIDWHAILYALGWAARNVGLFLVALAGATIANLLYSFPESGRLRRRLQAITNWKGDALARLTFLVVIFFGTFVSAVFIQPSTSKEAFLAGFTWLGVVSTLNKQSMGGDKS